MVEAGDRRKGGSRARGHSTRAVLRYGRGFRSGRWAGVARRLTEIDFGTTLDTEMPADDFFVYFCVEVPDGVTLLRFECRSTCPRTCTGQAV